MENTKKIFSRAPLRIGLAGGGTDLAPYSEVNGGSVVNITTNRFIYTELETTTDDNCKLISLDRRSAITLPMQKTNANAKDLALQAAVYDYVRTELGAKSLRGINMRTYADAPAGSGLGSSSTMVVSILKAFDELCSLGLSRLELAWHAHRIEREICKFAGGKQDHYAATFGGCNFMKFGPGQAVDIESIKISPRMQALLNAQMLLFYTGVSRASATVISDQVDQMQQRQGNSMEYFDRIKSEAVATRDAIVQEDIIALSGSLRRGWEYKVKTSDRVSTHVIDELMTEVLDAGALCGKISGAGGGGFAFFLVPIEKRKDVSSVLQRKNGSIHHCHLWFEGAQSWIM